MYSLLLLVPVMLGMAALFVVPNLETNDLALLTMVTRELPGWLVGIVGVAGALSAIVPMAVFMLCIGTMWGKSVIGGSDAAATSASRRSSCSPPASSRSAARCCSRTRSCGSRCCPTRASRSSCRRSSAGCCGGG